MNANIIEVKGNPLEDISVLGNVMLVKKNGDIIKEKKVVACQNCIRK
ncbi:MAG: imidazolonepropionase-like amidohydrolase [Saprospiraceae bacterium]|jgi:imidazolonepropionase-like amidohydrolase